VNREAILGLDEAGLCAAAQTCGACKLADTRTKVVFGNGQALRGVMFIGEGPGQTEDETGLPFVGRAGRLLDQMVAALGWKREELLVTNIVKCRPPGNRDPEADEVTACRPWLDAQIRLAEPRLLVAIGRPAAQSLLATTQSLSILRGKVHSLGGIPLLVTYHPAYLLRSPANKAEAWKDLRFLRQTLAQLEGGQSVPVNGVRVDR
jgi:DNA polymerase